MMPIGISQWKEMGDKYHYWDYFNELDRTKVQELFNKQAEIHHKLLECDVEIYNLMMKYVKPKRNNKKTR